MDEINLFTNIGHSHAQWGPVEAEKVNIEQHGSYRQVAQGWLHTSETNCTQTSSSGPKTKTTSDGLQTTPELNQSSYTYGTLKGGFYQTLLGTTPLQSNIPAKHLKYGLMFTFVVI